MKTETRPTIICIQADLYLSFQFFICVAFLICCSGNLAPQRQKRGLREPCAESLKTVTVVKSCPKDKETWDKRAKLKNCGDVPRNCSVTDFVYHCIWDEFGKNLLELCAATTKIIARFCSEFSSGGMFVQEHAEKPCKRCPFAYNSSMSYMYTECYELPELPESTITTTTYIENATKVQQQTTHEQYSNSTLIHKNGEARIELNLRSSLAYLTLGIFMPTFSILTIALVLRICSKRVIESKDGSSDPSSILRLVDPNTSMRGEVDRLEGTDEATIILNSISQNCINQQFDGNEQKEMH
ncbi:uncharacterized protein LOC134244118 isoform X2 [Saccostrea cucullata]|uniref:uncharacterized protein LOC134244118 isoform X2 n=1 Tax=Saccostrea cuccullata TaxID=36930 RepID=UPI002ED5B276